jgi:hypothetical protein
MGLSWGGFRSHQFNQHMASAANSTTADDELIAIRKWFDAYRLTWNGWILAPSLDDANKQVDKIDDRIDNKYWKPVEDAKDLAAAADAARKYLNRLPNGRHADACRGKIATHQADVARQENASWLNQREDDLKNAGGAASLQSLLGVLQDGFPHPEYVDPDDRGRLGTIEAEARNRLATIIAEEQWQQFIAEYHNAISAGDLTSAGRLLAERQPRDSQWEALAASFPNELRMTLDDKIKKLRADFRFDDAKDAVAEASRCLWQLETTFRASNSVLADQLLQAKRNLNSVEDKLEDDYDKHLYEQVLKKRTIATCKAYLDDKTPKQAMKAKVNEYLKYLNANSGRLDLIVSLRIDWDPQYNLGNDNTVEVRCDDKQVINEKDVPDDPGHISGEIQTFSLPGRRLEETIRLKVRITEVDVFWDNSGGEGEKSVKIMDLRRSNRIALKSDDGPFVNHAVFDIVDGLPKESELPPWKAQ